MAKKKSEEVVGEKTIAQKLAEYFDPDEVKFKPQAVSGSRAMAICFIDARCVMDRLDEVLGVTGWKDDYVQLSDHSVLCKLSLKIDGEWITKSDVGGESEQSDNGDRCKAAFSDALKRAAVKWGIGRYLYSLGMQWVEYDTQKRRFVETPKLPAWAIPKKFAKDGEEVPARQSAPRPAQQTESQISQSAGSQTSQNGTKTVPESRKVWSELNAEERVRRCLEGIAKAKNKTELDAVRDFYHGKGMSKSNLVELDKAYSDKLENIASSGKTAKA